MIWSMNTPIGMMMGITCIPMSRCPWGRTATRTDIRLSDTRTPMHPMRIICIPTSENLTAGSSDATLADAVLDRIVHKSHRINLKGESMRKVMAKNMFQGDWAVGMAAKERQRPAQHCRTK